MRKFIFSTAVPAILLGIVMGAVTTPAFAVDGFQDKASLPNLFELDGNPYQDTGQPIPPPPEGSWFTPHDWDSLFLWCDVDGNCPEILGTKVPYEFTTIIHDPAPTTIFTTGGSKDVYDISSWKWKDGSVPDKDEITNAYAAAYINPEDICYTSTGEVKDNCEEGDVPLHFAGDLIIYYGLDRFDNSGDAFAGFWFLQNNVGLDDVDMDFTVPFLGEDADLHVGKRYALDEYGQQIFDGDDPVYLRGDILVLVEYPQASGAVPVIKAYEWDPLELGAPNLDEDGKSIGPLEMIYNSKDQTATAECDGYGGKLACAITNKEDLLDEAEWAKEGFDQYLSKDGTTWFPYETFYEGGINLTQLLGGVNICVHTFLAETRSSTSETAQLKDFVLGNFELCGSKIRTEVHDPSHSDVTMWDPLDYASIMAGTAIHDFAEVEVVGPGLQMDPSGDVQFKLFDGTDCSVPTTAVSPNSWIQSVEPGQDPMGWGEENDNFGWAATGSMVLPAAQCYSFQAEFLSDEAEYFPDVTAICEPFCIAKYPSTIRTEIHAQGGHSPDLQGGMVYVGSTIHDHAYVTVNGEFTGAPTPTGTVSFKLFETLDCSGGFTSLSGTLDTSGEAVSPGFTPAGDTVLSYKASYSGDANYEASTESACEPLTVDKYDALVETQIHEGTGHAPDIQGTSVNVGLSVHDHAYVSVVGEHPEAPLPEGNVIFQIFDGSSCTAPALASFGGIAWDQTGALDSGGAVTALFTPPGNTSFSIKASYAGDANFRAANDSACETLTVNKYNPNILTKVKVRDLAEVTGSGPAPTGEVWFTTYSDQTCSTYVSGPVKVGLSSGAAELAVDTVLGPTTDWVSYKAEYKGDDYYNPVIHDCEVVSFSLY